VFGKKGLSAADIGNDSIKAVELKKQFGKIMLKGFNHAPNRTDGFKNGEIVQPDVLSASLKTALRGYPKEVIFSCCGTSMMVKKIRIPKMDPDFISEQIRWEAEQYIPFNIEEVNIEFDVLDTPPNEDTMGLLLVAILKDKVSAYANLFAQAGYNAIIADVAGFALANCYTFNYPEQKSGAVVLLDVGSFYTNLVVMYQAKVVYYRDIQFGGAKYDEELATNMGIGQDEAKTIKQSKDPSSLPDLAADTIVSVNEKLSSQILGSLDFFKNTEGFNKPFSQVYITGGGSLVPGLTQALSTTLGVGVEFLDAFKKINVPPKLLKTVDQNRLQYTSAVSIGLAIRELSKV
jgi:type IV pilus assembly protein PilM